MGNIFGHNDALAFRNQILHTVYGKTTRAFQHDDHGIAAGCMRADLFSLFKRKQGHADLIVLHKSLADDLTILIMDLILEHHNRRFFNVAIHKALLVPATTVSIGVFYHV